jgi:trans-aconitate methyltransferase
MSSTDAVLEADIIARDDSSISEDASLASSTTSVTDSVFDYRRLHGRPYKVTDTTEYWAPVDSTQNDAFDMLHNVHLIVAGNKLFQAPIENPAKVLDVGTGTGIWAVDLAHQYPSAEVTGTDIAATQPSWVPPNSHFLIEDCLLEWSWPPNHFDLIHTRALYGCIPDWTAFYAKAFKHVKPGGWFEHVERTCRLQSDYVALTDDHPFNKWAELSYGAGEKTGRSFAIAEGHQMKEYMEKAGFVDVHERKIKMPMHGWPKDPNLKNAGYLGQLALDQSMDGLSTFVLTQILGWSREQAFEFTESVRKESRKFSNLRRTIVWGRKPE